MKAGRLNLRISERRLAKLKVYAENKDKTITQLIENWIDRLPSQRIDDSSSTPLPDQSDD
jgi:predicted HicB family RNase H-like nuclease